MMTLKEAIASGKRFTRSGDSDLGEYLSAEEFLEGGLSIEDYNATDYVVEPDSVTSVKMTTLIDAWNTAKGNTNGIAQATASPFFSRFVSQLKTKGVDVLNNV